MPDEPGAGRSAADFLGNFRGYIQKIQEELESQYGEDAGPYESVTQRAAAEAQFKNLASIHRSRPTLNEE